MIQGIHITDPLHTRSSSSLHGSRYFIYLFFLFLSPNEVEVFIYFFHFIFTLSPIWKFVYLIFILSKGGGIFIYILFLSPILVEVSHMEMRQSPLATASLLPSGLKATAWMLR